MDVFDWGGHGEQEAGGAADDGTGPGGGLPGDGYDLLALGFRVQADAVRRGNTALFERVRAHWAEASGPRARPEPGAA